MLIGSDASLFYGVNLELVFSGSVLEFLDFRRVIPVCVNRHS